MERTHTPLPGGVPLFLSPLLTLLLVLLLLPMALAQPPVAWKASAARTDEGTYRLTVQASIREGWHLYAAGAGIAGLEGITLQLPSEALQMDSLQQAGNRHPLQDPLFGGKFLQVYTGELRLQQDLRFDGPVPARLPLRVTAYAANGDTFLPLSTQLTVDLAGGQLPSADPARQLKLTGVDLERPQRTCGTETTADGSIWLVFLLGMGGGLLALLTPCVFPMVPLTVTFFTSRSGGKRESVRNGFSFGLCILLLYLLCSLPFHLLNSVEPGLLNSLSTNVWVNLLFFGVFVFFALSFFGLFEITLSSRLTNRVDAKGSLQSWGGIFFLALTLALVSFSCTGPILGTLLVGSLSSSSGAWQLTAGMAGFGLALALPFALFAMSPGWLRHLPKSGGWLDTVKKTLAFVELGLALKFLSNADLVAQWGLLKREVFLAAWFLIALGLAFYLLGLWQLPGEDRQPISIRRKVAAVLVMSFALYLLPGIVGLQQDGLRLLSGFPPPRHYSIYPPVAGMQDSHPGKEVTPQAVNDFAAGLRLAREQQKPLLVDFTGWACVNCRKMEEQVWTAPEITQLLNEEFILVSLYVDDRQPLSATERFTFASAGGTEREIGTVGEKWATFQALNFGQVTQPLYVLLSPEGELLNRPVGYTSDTEAYSAWLACGQAAYQESLAEKAQLTRMASDHPHIMQAGLSK